jgi:nucleotidyltransferase substrate binding protein (TIGR01987 family)
MNIVNLKHLNKVISALVKGQVRYNNNLSDDLLRDGLIQRFKVTYDLSHRILKTFIGTTYENPKQINQMVFKDWITLAHERGIVLNDWSLWREYREQRSKTIYSFDLTVANNVLSIVPDFVKEVDFLHSKISNKLIEGRF